MSLRVTVHEVTLPDGGVVRELPDGSHLEDLLTGLGLAGSGAVVTLVGGVLVAPQARVSHRLQDGDEVTVLPLIHGG